jgi:alanine-glyoxylate transaminase / serine-glyoxylate transaminase / serine-pyruvate transaminase
VSNNNPNSASTSSINPPQRFLFGPGPTQVHPRVYEAMSTPIVGHLDQYFFQISGDIQQMLRTVFGTENKLTFAISGTGSAGMETAISNFVEPGTNVVSFANGFFCDRMCEMATRNGGEVIRFEKPWGEFFANDEAAAFIRRERPQVVMYVQAETSTGVFQESKAICDAAHEVGAIVIADVVTSLGAMPVRVDATGIDVAYSCTQKGLSCTPGLAPITVSERALARLNERKNACRSWYFDLKLINDYLNVSHRYHHTASATLFYALHEALSLIVEEGVEQRWARHSRCHQQFVKGIEGLGLSMLVADDSRRIVNLNTPRVPEGVDEAKVRATLLSEHGIEIMGGFGPLAGKIFRIGIMGPLATEESVTHFLDVFAKALTAAGHKPRAKAAAATARG